MSDMRRKRRAFNQFLKMLISHGYRVWYVDLKDDNRELCERLRSQAAARSAQGQVGIRHFVLEEEDKDDDMKEKETDRFSND